MHRVAFFWTFRILLGLLVFAAGLGKLLDIPGYVAILRTYRLDFVPAALYLPGAVAVVVFELGLGCWILSAWRLATAALLSVAMHAGYLVLLTASLLRGLKLENCGCFGVFLARPLTWYSPLEDAALMAVSYSLFQHARALAARQPNPPMRPTECAGG